MPVQPTYPGVYVQETASGVRTIAGVSTSTTLFVGMASRGPIGVPVLVSNYTEFVDTFTDDTTTGDLPRHVKLFFLNGGSRAWVIRIAQQPSQATVTLRTEGGVADSLVLTARDAGFAGESIRAAVIYTGANPEDGFNLELFRWEENAAGVRTRTAVEQWQGLSMDPASPRYAAAFLTQNSRLVTAADAAPAATPGFSQAGRPVEHTGSAASFVAAWEARLGNAVATNELRLRVGNEQADVDLAGIDVGALQAGNFADTATALVGAIEAAINPSIAPETISASFESGPDPRPGAGNQTTCLRLTAGNDVNVTILPASGNDLAVPLMLGAEQGGLEWTAHSARRPAPTGVVFGVNGANLAALHAFASLTQGLFPDNGGTTAVLRMDTLDAAGSPSVNAATFSLEALATTGVAVNPLWVDAEAGSNTGNSDGLREKLALVRDAVNDHQAANSTSFPWRAELHGLRLTVTPARGDDVYIGSLSALANTPAALADFDAAFGRNVRHLCVGISGVAGTQTPAGAVAQDGDPPIATDYDAAYVVADREIDLFNLLVLPPVVNAAAPLTDLWPAASIFCQQQRAFLVMDSPAWQGAQDALNGIAALRVGLVRDHAAVYYPDLRVKENGREVQVGAAGAVAGLMARIDASRGVWKSPAGTEATLRAVTGLSYRLSDADNGVINPRAINALRAFPAGVVAFGARTMHGDDDEGHEYKYVPVRRLALYLEESLYRGLQWAVFEPNDEPLWAQIRLNVGAFLHNLYRQGAFQGRKPSEAYFVKCDSETTTQTHRNLGVVNVVVGFAPLKPAEFIILSIQQMAGAIQV